MEIATGQAEEEYDASDAGKDQAAAELGRKGGRVGICGGYTTFSAFSLDFVTLMNRGQALYALAYAIGSSALSIAALYAALRLMRIVLR